MIFQFNNMKPPVVEVKKLDFSESHYVKDTKKWFASTLYEEVKKEKLEPFEFPLAAFDLTIMGFSTSDMESFIFQCKRVFNADTSIPIILDDSGAVADGFHRVCKAIIEGKRTIKAYRLNRMPEEDETLDRGE